MTFFLSRVVGFTAWVVEDARENFLAGVSEVSHDGSRNKVWHEYVNYTGKSAAMKRQIKKSAQRLADKKARELSGMDVRVDD